MQEKVDSVQANDGNMDKLMRIYLAEVLGLDQQAGRLLDKLDELGVANNTVVLPVTMVQKTRKLRFWKP